jgi:hypothetical protein
LSKWRSRLSRDLPLSLVVCLFGAFCLTGCTTDPHKLATQMELDEATCRREAPMVTKINKDFCLTHVTQMREEHEKSVPTILGNVIGGVMTAAGTLFVGGI